MKSCKKIVSCFLCIAILTSFLCVPAFASDGIAGAAQDFFEWSVNWSQGLQNSFWKAIYGDSWMEDETGGWTGADRDELTARYNEYVSGLQTDLGTATLIDGGIRIYVPITEISSSNQYITVNNYTGGSAWSTSFIISMSNRGPNLYWDKIKAPCAGSYSAGYSFYTDNPDRVTLKPAGSGSTWAENVSVSAGAIIGPSTFTAGDYCASLHATSSGRNYYASGSIWLDFYPATGALSSTHDITINSRPAAIVGDYGIIGDNGTIVHIEGNKIVDETGGTVYNPATGETQSYTDYVYDYSDRSYLLTLEDGNTIKVMYGDENITIHEGDTIYNIYYLIPDDSGSGGGSDSGDTPSGEDMSWWKQAWTSFTDKLFSILGNGGSSGNPDTAPAVPDDEETGEKGYSVIDLFVVLKDGTWAFITGIVSTAYDGFTGFVESVSSAGSFFTFYDEESEDGILFVPLEGGETIWD